MFRVILFPLIPLLLGATAAAQQVVSAKAGLIYYSEGSVFFDGVPARSLAGARYPALSNGQLLETGQGHAEILLGSGAMLWAGRDSKIRMQDTRLDDTRLHVEAGSAMVEVKNIPEGNRIRVEVGESGLDLIRPGLYRFDANPPGARVYEGDLVAGAMHVIRGQEIHPTEKTTAAPFERVRPDEFHYWSAWRSYQLAGEAGFEGGAWGLHGLYGESRRNAAFAIEFPVNPGAARLQYLTASTAGLVYYLKGGAMIGGGPRPNQARLPFRLTPENTLATSSGDWAEIFVGVGVVARLGENATIQLVDATPLDATIRLSEGKALFEVSKTAQDTRIRVAVGESVTELVRPGLYEFDAGASFLQIYGGEALASLGNQKIRVREGQMSALTSAKDVKRFDIKQKDSLFQWSKERSLVLARSNGLFMTQWERVGRLLRHPQFGSVERGPSGRSR